jgi:hypothetical protein
MQEIDIEQDVGAIEAAKKAMALLYEALVTPLFGLKILAFIIGLFLWLWTCSSILCFWRNVSFS